MKLSIVTINYNNAEGLRKTLASVASQTYRNIEHIIIDAASTDGSVDIIREYESSNSLNSNSLNIKWVSEKDKGIYDGMNKGIEIALGRRAVKEKHTSYIIHNTSMESLCNYIQILNSGDILASNDVTERMMSEICKLNTEHLENRPAIFYGNMIKQWPDGKRVVDKCEAGHLSMLSFYHGTLNHDSAYIRRDLFERFGLYDENLRIVSDWKWFLKVIPLGGVTPVYVDIDVTVFDMTGVSESNTDKWRVERRPVLEDLVPPMVLADYDKYGEDMRMIDRLRCHHMHGVVRFIERVLFKLEKWHILKG